ncbi:DUF6461 domain-containing protein [Nocardia sp. NPDC003482]
MTTSDPWAPFQWVHNDHNSGGRWLGDIFTVSFFRGLDPSEVVRRFSRGEDRGREGGFDELWTQTMESYEKTGRGSGGVTVGVVQVGEWSVAIELLGWMATLTHVLTELSPGCEVLGITHHEYADDRLAYAIDGTLVTGCNLACTHLRHGSEPDRLNEFMREVGMTVDVQDDEPDYFDEDYWESEEDIDYTIVVPKAFALAANLTRVRFTPELLDRPMLIGSVAFR